MTGHLADELRPPQRKALEALLSSASVATAADRAGVSERSLWRWLAEPGFKAALVEAQRELRQAVSIALRSAALVAVETLTGVAVDGSAPPGARVSAARTLLELAYRDVADDLEARLSELEARLG